MGIDAERRWMRENVKAWSTQWETIIKLTESLKSEHGFSESDCGLILQLIKNNHYEILTHEALDALVAKAYQKPIIVNAEGYSTVNINADESEPEEMPVNYGGYPVDLMVLLGRTGDMLLKEGIPETQVQMFTNFARIQWGYLREAAS